MVCRNSNCEVEVFSHDQVDIAKGRSAESGNYRRNVERFASWYQRRNDEGPTFENLEVQHFRQFSRALRAGSLQEMRTDDPARGPVLTYYPNLSAYVGWCVDEGYLDEHLDDTEQARYPLPEDDGRRSGDQQA